MENYKSIYTGEEIDAALERAAAGGALDTSIANKLSIPQNIPANANLDVYKTAGMFYNDSGGTTVQNAPTSTASFSLFVERTGAYGDGTKQTFTQFTEPNAYCRVGYNGTWGNWIPIATATPPTESGIPLTNCTGTAKYSKDQFGRVLIPAINLTAAASIAPSATIATLPISYRPKEEMKVTAILGSTVGKLIIGTAGTIKPSAAIASGAEIIAASSISFAAES